MHFYVVTIFPQIFDSFLTTSLVGKASDAGLIQVKMVDPRDFTNDRHRSVDDTPFGGGDGMVMKPEPIVEALESISKEHGDVYRVLLSPQGEKLQQKHLVELRDQKKVALVCGRYEGFDERIRSFVHQEISLGDFVLNGGEVAAMAVIDGVARLVPGVVGNNDSLLSESYSTGLLEYPQYTRPRSFRGMQVPDVLLSGDHQKINNWRQEQMLHRTEDRRPDLLLRYFAEKKDQNIFDDDQKISSLTSKTYIALLHYPVCDREGKIVTTAITNLDLHDIARSAHTYGLAGYFVVTPLTPQQELAKRIISHWQEGYGARTNEKRKQALSLVKVAKTLDEVISQIEQKEGHRPLTVATSAKGGFSTRKQVLKCLQQGQPIVILLGTGWGLAPQVLESSDFCLEPIKGVYDYNHLSVRSAAAILLDRLFGMRE